MPSDADRDADQESRLRWASAAAGVAFLASVSGFVSIAASHILLGLSLILLLAGRLPFRMPAVGAPLGAFILLTLISAAASDDPAAALPQIKKFYVFLFLPVLYSLLPRVANARRLMEAWFVVGAGVAALATVQFAGKWMAAEQAGQDFSAVYFERRITGFFSHWMTFSQVAMLALTMLLAYLLFSPTARKGRALWAAAAAALGLGLVLSNTRSAWLAMAAAGLYFVWRRPKLLWLALPAALVLALWSPDLIRRRIESIGDLSQNQARIIMWRTGWRMIKAHPLLGVGPERVGPLFEQYQPEDVTEKPDAYYGHLHNIYIHYAAERGLPALVALLWLLGRVLWDAGLALRRLPPGASDRRFLLEGAVASTLAVMTVGCFDLTLGDSEVLAAYMAVVAVGYVAVKSVAGDAVRAQDSSAVKTG